MNRDQIKGKVKDAEGRVERQAGEWTDNTDAQIDGAKRQVEGKVQKMVGDIKDTSREKHRESADREHEDARDEDVPRKKTA